MNNVVVLDIYVVKLYEKRFYAYFIIHLSLLLLGVSHRRLAWPQTNLQHCDRQQHHVIDIHSAELGPTGGEEWGLLEDVVVYV